MLNLCSTLIDTDDEKIRFTKLYEQYRHLMFYVSKEILKDEQNSEDAVQEAFLRVAKNFYKIGDILCPETRNFLVIITRNVALTMVKNQHSDMELDLYTDFATYEASEDVFESVSNKILTECLLELPEKYRDILYLYYLYGYSFSEISNLLCISSDVARKRAERARALLKQLLEKEWYYHE